MIDEKKLIEELKERNYQLVFNLEEQALLDKVVRIIKKQPKIEWISVGEQLPNESGMYLILLDNNDIFNTEFDDDLNEFGTCNDEYGINEYGDISVVDRKWFKLDDVIAWMPLPKPYKGDE